MQKAETENGVFFTEREWKFFKLEIEDMFKSGTELDIEKAVRNARYLAEIDRRIENVEKGINVKHFTSEEWDAFVKSQNL